MFTITALIIIIAQALREVTVEYYFSWNIDFNYVYVHPYCVNATM